MTDLTPCEIRCTVCDQWANSRIQFDTAKAFFTSTLVGTTVRCNWCGEITPCGIGNMRFYEQKDGKGIGTYIEGKDAFMSQVKKKEKGFNSVNAQKDLIESY
jgi:hypothetical protein